MFDLIKKLFFLKLNLRVLLLEEKTKLIKLFLSNCLLNIAISHYFIINILFVQNKWNLLRNYQDAKSNYQEKWDTERNINKIKMHY